MICFYHKDTDGRAAGAIVKFVHKDCRMEPIDYKDHFPIEKIQPGEEVYIVDFGPDPEIMNHIVAKVGFGHIVWIDHHKSTLDKYKDFKYNLPGIREIGKAGCLLTWDWFTNLQGDKRAPYIIQLVNDWDIWAHKMDPDTNYLQAGLTTLDINPDNQDFWRRHFIVPKEYETKGAQDSYQWGLLKEILEKGKIITQQREMSNKGLIAEWGFPVDWQGKKWLALNFGKGSSKIFDSVKDKYDGFITFIFDGRKYTVSLYSDRPDMDVSVICLRLGGGGHKGAAGFTCRELPFRRTDE